jgi:hypothetical protein
LTIFGAAQFDFGIIEEVAAPGTTPPGIVLEKLDVSAALGTLQAEDVIRLPVAGILAGTFYLFHGFVLRLP